MEEKQASTCPGGLRCNMGNSLHVKVKLRVTGVCEYEQIKIFTILQHISSLLKDLNDYN